MRLQLIGLEKACSSLAKRGSLHCQLWRLPGSGSQCLSGSGLRRVGGCRQVGRGCIHVRLLLALDEQVPSPISPTPTHTSVTH